jgi:two-component system cell cycle sensor histidine kinase/response regulator CckA
MPHELMPAHAAKTIVLVEDEEVVRRLVSRVLGQEGYRVLDATSAEEGLAILGSESEADLLLTDVTLPGELDGVELSRRAREEREDLKLIYMSGYGEEDMSDEFLRVAGEAAFIGKPFSPNELLETVNELLGEL